VVADLLARGVRRRELRRAVDALAGYGAWPLSEAALATDGRRIYLREEGELLALTDRGWQRIAVLPDVRPEEVRLRLRRAGSR
jgi:hypothetical protein